MMYYLSGFHEVSICSINFTYDLIAMSQPGVTVRQVRLFSWKHLALVQIHMPVNFNSLTFIIIEKKIKKWGLI